MMNLTLILSSLRPRSWAVSVQQCTKCSHSWYFCERPISPETLSRSSPATALHRPRSSIWGQLRAKRRLVAQQRSSRTTTRQRSSPSPAIVQGRDLPSATDLQSAAACSALNPLTVTFIPDVSHDVSSEWLLAHLPPISADMSLGIHKRHNIRT